MQKRDSCFTLTWPVSAIEGLLVVRSQQIVVVPIDDSAADGHKIHSNSLLLKEDTILSKGHQREAGVARTS